jgi:hypothetical protein
MGNSARTIAILLWLVAGMSGGCATPRESALVKEQVVQFHALLDAGRGSDIYDAASPDFRNAGPKVQAVAYFDGVHRKLGTVQKSEVYTWQVNNMTNGTFFLLTYKTQYTAGEAMEYFVYRLTNGKPILMRYDISSDVLVTK